jgi:hypothetical protein
MITFENAIEYINNSVKPDIVLWLGDNQPYNDWEQEMKTQLDTTYVITGIMTRYFPKRGHVFPLLGNHEGFPTNILNRDEYWPYRNVSNLWSHWLTKEAKESMKSVGYYHQLINGTNTRIISLEVFDIINSNCYNWPNEYRPTEQVR